MKYEEYAEAKRQYDSAFSQYINVLGQKQELFSKTQPKAVSYDKDKVKTSPKADNYDNYLIEKERMQIDLKLDEARSIVQDRKVILDLKEQDLRNSMETDDLVYTLKYLDNTRVYKIASRLGYSEMQIFRIIKKIEEKLKRC